jgi:acyl carrier protein
MTTRTLAVSEIAEIVIGFLAAESGIPASQLRADLEAAGPELPVDSLLVVEVLVKVEDACGVRLEINEEVARSTRSVMTFARSIRRALAMKGDGQHGR